MQPIINVITLAVSDLDRALTFYRDGLGLDSPGVVGTEFTGDESNPDGAVVMFRLSGGLVLALYPRTSWRKTRMFRSDHQRQVNSVSATQLTLKRRWTHSSSRLRLPVQP